MRLNAAREAIYQSGLLGCGEADTDLSETYKSRLGEGLERKHGSSLTRGSGSRSPTAGGPNPPGDRDVKHQRAVHRDAEILEGTPVFVGTRVPFQTLIDYLEDGQSLVEFLADFPTVSRDQAIAALGEAKEAGLAQTHESEIEKSEARARNQSAPQRQDHGHQDHSIKR
jgi:uncharacterized protein (DUF433 family)